MKVSMLLIGMGRLSLWFATMRLMADLILDLVLGKSISQTISITVFRLLVRAVEENKALECGDKLVWRGDKWNEEDSQFRCGNESLCC